MGSGEGLEVESLILEVTLDFNSVLTESLDFPVLVA